MPWGMTGTGAGQPWSEPPVLPGNTPWNFTPAPSAPPAGFNAVPTGQAVGRTIGNTIGGQAGGWMGGPIGGAVGGFFGRQLGSLIGHGFGSAINGVKGLAGMIFNRGGNAGDGTFVPPTDSTGFNGTVDPNSDEARTAAYVRARERAMPVARTPAPSAFGDLMNRLPPGSLLGGLMGNSPTADRARAAAGNQPSGPMTHWGTGMPGWAAAAMAMNRARNLP